MIKSLFILGIILILLGFTVHANTAIVWEIETDTTIPVKEEAIGIFNPYYDDTDLLTKKTLVSNYLIKPSELTFITVEQDGVLALLPVAIEYSEEGTIERIDFEISEKDLILDLGEFLNLEQELDIENSDFSKRQGDENYIEIKVLLDNTNAPKIGGVMSLKNLGVGSEFELDKKGVLRTAYLVSGSDGGEFLINGDKYGLPPAATMNYYFGLIQEMDFESISNNNLGAVTFYQSTRTGFGEPVQIYNAKEISKQNGVLKVSGENTNIIDNEGNIVGIQGSVLYNNKKDFYLLEDSTATIEFVDREEVIAVKSKENTGVWITECNEAGTNLVANRFDLCGQEFIAKSVEEKGFTFVTKEYTEEEELTSTYSLYGGESSIFIDESRNKVDITGDAVYSSCNNVMTFSDNIYTPITTDENPCKESSISYGSTVVQTTLNEDGTYETTFNKIAKKSNKPVVEQINEQTQEIILPIQETQEVMIFNPEGEPLTNDFGEPIVFDTQAEASAYIEEIILTGYNDAVRADISDRCLSAEHCVYRMKNLPGVDTITVKNTYLPQVTGKTPAEISANSEIIYEGMYVTYGGAGYEIPSYSTYPDISGKVDTESFYGNIYTNVIQPDIDQTFREIDIDSLNPETRATFTSAYTVIVSTEMDIQSEIELLEYSYKNRNYDNAKIYLGKVLTQVDQQSQAYEQMFLSAGASSGLAKKRATEYKNIRLSTIKGKVVSGAEEYSETIDSIYELFGADYYGKVQDHLDTVNNVIGS